MKSITKVFTSICIALIIFSFSTLAATAGKTQLQILYMNHGPVRPTIANIKSLLTDYTKTVDTSWYDVDEKEGKNFMKKNKIQGHIPMLILLNGQSDFTIEGKDIKLQGFPTGASPFKRVEGNWSVDDLKILLDKATR